MMDLLRRVDDETAAGHTNLVCGKDRVSRKSWSGFGGTKQHLPFARKSFRRYCKFAARMLEFTVIVLSWSLIMNHETTHTLGGSLFGEIE
jgi:hypothetical protein